MKQAFILFATLCIICSCSNSDKQATSKFPAYPDKVSEVKASVIGKKYSVTNVGTISPFEMDKENPYNWMDGKKDSTPPTLKVRDERMGMKFNFTSDNTVAVTDDNKTANATY